MGRGVVGVRLGVDEHTHWHGRQLLDDLQELAALDWIVAGVDQHDAVLGQDDAGVRLEFVADPDIDAVGEPFDLRSQVLRGRQADERKRGDEREGTTIANVLALIVMAVLLGGRSCVPLRANPIRCACPVNGRARTGRRRGTVPAWRVVAEERCVGT